MSITIDKYGNVMSTTRKSQQCSISILLDAVDAPKRCNSLRSVLSVEMYRFAIKERKKDQKLVCMCVILAVSKSEPEDPILIESPGYKPQMFQCLIFGTIIR